MQKDRIGTWDISRLAVEELRERDGPHREGEEPKPMMYGHEKSDSVIVAVKPANKAANPAVEQSAARPAAAEPVERRAGTKGNADQQSTCRTLSPGKRVTGAGTHTANFCRHIPEVGAVCGKAACTDLCGGRAMKGASHRYDLCAVELFSAAPDFWDLAARAYFAFSYG